MREGDCGFQRIANSVAEPTVSGQSLGDLRLALGMDEERHDEFLGLCPHWMELGIGEVSGNGASDRNTLQAPLFRRGLELLRGEVGSLQR